jgi:hypothetical protein
VDYAFRLTGRLSWRAKTILASSAIIPVPLVSTKTDEQGNPVYGECYAATFLALKEAALNKTALKNVPLDKSPQLPE